MFDRFFSVFSLVSRIPAPRTARFDLSRLDFFLPLTGLLAGLCAALAAAVSYVLLRSIPAACLFALLAQYFCFNLFHLDGLADTADAFLGTVSPEKTREILKDSRIGVYGLFAGCMGLALKTVLLGLCLSHIVSWQTAYVLFCLYPVAGRFAAALIPCWFSPARQEGLGALAKNSRASRAFSGAAWASAALFLPSAAAFVTGARELIALVMPLGAAGIVFGAGFLCARFYGKVYTRRIGGYSGDALGAAIETGELAALFLAALFFNLNDIFH